MKIHAFIALIRARYATLSEHQKPLAIAFTTFFGVVVAFFFIKACLAMIAHQTRALPPPMMIRQANHIIIPTDSPLRSQIIIKAVGTLSMPHVVAVPGIIEANPSQIVNLFPPLTGRLIELKVTLGDTVQRGQLLAVISSPALAQAYAEYNSARSVFKLTREALNRAQKVNRVGANSTRDIELATSAHVQSVAELKRTKANLTILGRNKRNQLIIKSPLKGKVTALNYGRGSYVTDLTVPLLTISNFNSVWVTANIPENLVGVVRKGQRAVVKLSAYPQRTLYGNVSFVSSFLDPDTHRNPTRITLRNLDGKLQPNMFATVHLFLPQPSYIVIPVSAIFMNDDTTSVYVESSPWFFERRDVVLGDEDGLNVRVLSGLTVGERVVTAGGIFVND